MKRALALALAACAHHAPHEPLSNRAAPSIANTTACVLEGVVTDFETGERAEYSTLTTSGDREGPPMVVGKQGAFRFEVPVQHQKFTIYYAEKVQEFPLLRSYCGRRLKILLSPGRPFPVTVE